MNDYESYNFGISPDEFVKIIKTFGKDAQRHKTIEELNELAVAVAHNNRIEIVEELPDVIIMLIQICLIYDIHPLELRARINEKLKRTKDRIREGYYDNKIKE